MFKDRYDAAHQLVQKLREYKNNPNVVIIAIPRGGLELGSVLAKELHAPLDIALTKKIGFPSHPEYALGAVSLDSVLLDEQILSLYQDLIPYVKQEVIRLQAMLEDRYQKYKGNTPSINLNNKIVIVVDDGVATGKTLAVTLDLIKKSNPQKIIVALPVAPAGSLALLRSKSDDLICLLIPTVFHGVGQFYKSFDQVDDREAIRLLHEANV